MLHGVQFTRAIVAHGQRKAKQLGQSFSSISTHQFINVSHPRLNVFGQCRATFSSNVRGQLTDSTVLAGHIVSDQAVVKPVALFIQVVNNTTGSQTNPLVVLRDMPVSFQLGHRSLENSFATVQIGPQVLIGLEHLVAPLFEEVVLLGAIPELVFDIFGFLLSNLQSIL